MKKLTGAVIILAVILSIKASAQETTNNCACSGNCNCKKAANYSPDSRGNCKCGSNCVCRNNASVHMMHSEMHQQANRHQYLLMMDTMMTAMDKAPLSTHLEINFLAQMIPHHQGAVQMARYQIENGVDYEMVQLAKSILAEQSYEINEMMLLLKSPGARTNIELDLYKNSMDRTMETMMASMPKDSLSFNTNDLAFATVMLPHHQAAIDMCVALIQLGPNSTLKTLAEKIIASQQIEISQMDTFIKKFKHLKHNSKS